MHLIVRNTFNLHGLHGLPIVAALYITWKHLTSVGTLRLYLLAHDRQDAAIQATHSLLLNNFAHHLRMCSSGIDVLRMGSIVQHTRVYAKSTAGKII